MAGQFLSDASGYGATEFDTKIPSLNDQANIVEAFKLYHYGLDNYTGAEAPAADSIHAHLSDFNTRLELQESTPSGGGVVQTAIPHLLVRADNTTTVLPEGYIWVDQDGTVPSVTAAGVVSYLNDEPSPATHGQVWIDKDYNIAPVNISAYAPTANPVFTGTVTAPTLNSTTLTATSASATNLTVTGATNIAEVTETVNTLSFVSGSVTGNYNDSAIFYTSSGTIANFGVILTNIPTTNNKVTTMSFMITQAATGYIPNAISVNGSNQTIRWVGGTPPTPTSSIGKIDIFIFSLLRISDSWIVLGSSNLNI
jgi:hypothetical protein